jgi:ABC-type Fe3+-hydroxamate transport system substrate-binding protein
MLAIIISVIALLVIGTVIYLYKSGKIQDKDGDFIPDVIEEKVEEVKQRATRVAEEVKDVAAAAKEVVKQSKDVVNAAKGNTTRKGRRPKAKSKPTE